MIISAISSPVRCAIIALSYFPTDLTGAIQTVPVAVVDPATERGERSLCQVGAAPRVPPAVRILGPKPSPIEPAALDD
jgi:hypothetical protein